MIAAELALLTAVALFFSTFSSSALLSVVFTVGVFVAGLFSADLRSFGDIVDVSPAVAQLVVDAIGWVVPAFSAFDVKAQVVHGLPLPAGFVLRTRWSTPSSTSRRCSRRRSRCSRGGSSSDGTRGAVVGSIATVVPASALAAACSTRATRRVRCRRPTERLAVPAVRADRRSRCSCRSMRSPPTSTGFARSSTTAATASPRARPAASSCCSRCWI